VPYTFLEPLVFSFVTGMAVWATCVREARWRSVSGVGAVVLAGRRAVRWGVRMVVLGRRASLRELSVGLSRFRPLCASGDQHLGGARLVDGISRCAGVLGPFQSRLDPAGSVVGHLPDVRLFLGLQAVCLASPALLVFGIARRYDCDGPTSAVWSATYLAFPSVGLLNLSYSYGWHPVSVAIPLMFLAVWACCAAGAPAP
jgi:hypothetical protein